MEDKGLQRLMDKFLIEVGQFNYHNIKVTQPAKGKTQFLNKIGLSVKNALNAKDLRYIFSLEDLDKADLKTIEENFYSKVNQDHHSMFTPHFAVREVETWILTDRELLERYNLKGVKEYEDPEREINTNKKPSVYLEELFRNNGMRKYKKTVDGVNLLGDLNIRLIYQKCPNFKKLIDDILRVLEIENIYSK